MNNECQSKNTQYSECLFYILRRLLFFFAHASREQKLNQLVQYEMKRAQKKKTYSELYSHSSHIVCAI